MAGFLFKLETVEGEPVRPADCERGCPNWRLGERSEASVEPLLRPE